MLLVFHHPKVAQHVMTWIRDMTVLSVSLQCYVTVCLEEGVCRRFESQASSSLCLPCHVK